MQTDVETPKPSGVSTSDLLERPTVGLKLRCKNAVLTITEVLPNGDVLMDAISPYPRKTKRKPVQLHTPRADWVRYVQDGKIWPANAHGKP